MPKKRYNAEEIIHKLWGSDVLLGQGKTVSQACKQIGVSDQTYYRWRKAYGGMKVDQARRLKELEAENARRTAGVDQSVARALHHDPYPDSLRQLAVRSCARGDHRAAPT